MQLKTKNATFAPKATRIKICAIIHNWTPVLIQCVSKRVSSFFLQKPLFTRVLLYLLTITGSTVVLKWSPWSLFVFLRMNFLLKGLEGALSHKRNN